MNAYKDRIAESERVPERKRARVGRGAGDVPVEPGRRDDEQVAVRHADAFGGDVRENQHEEDRMRDIHVGKLGPEAAGEEQPDKLRKTVRYDQEASSASASSDPTVALEYPASGETQDRPGSVLVRKSGHVDDEVQISALDVSYEMDGRKSRNTGEVLDWYRGKDAGDLKRSELNELVENLTCSFSWVPFSWVPFLMLPFLLLPFLLLPFLLSFLFFLLPLFFASFVFGLPFFLASLSGGSFFLVGRRGGAFFGERFLFFEEGCFFLGERERELFLGGGSGGGGRRGAFLFCFFGCVLFFGRERGFFWEW